MIISRNLAAFLLALCLLPLSLWPRKVEAQVSVGGQTCYQVWGLYDYYSNGNLTASQWEADGVNCYDNGGGGLGNGGMGDWGYAGGAGGGGGPAPTAADMCSMLLVARPQDCPDRTTRPSGWNYGNYGGALGMMRTYINDPNNYIMMSGALQLAMSRHTDAIVAGRSFSDANSALRRDLANICGPLLQDYLDSSDRYGDMTTRGISTNFCTTVMSRFDFEASGQIGFVNWVMNDYSNVGAVDFNDLPWSGTFKNAMGLDNSLVAKYAEAAHQASCNSYWTQMDRLKCAG